MTATTNADDLDEVTIVRVFAAPRELVFACMTDPTHLTHFWGPVGVSTPIENITVDLRVGGVFETVMVNDESGETYPSKGVYTEITPPSVLAWEEPSGMANRSEFIDLGDGRTEVRIHQTNVPAMYRSPEAQAGMKSSLDRFATYLATQTS
ncbi:MAG: SRPBCC domain-containing protein [Frankiaceae bacterium]|nr:SRPBCC domain-containing protein [Frankiaceae bacterium]